MSASRARGPLGSRPDEGLGGAQAAAGSHADITNTLALLKFCLFSWKRVGGAEERGAGCLGAAQFRGWDCRVSKKPGSGAGSLLPRACSCSRRRALLGPTAQKDPHVSVALWQGHPLPLVLSCVPKDQMRLSKCRARGAPWWL